MELHSGDVDKQKFQTELASLKQKLHMQQQELESLRRLLRPELPPEEGSSAGHSRAPLLWESSPSLPSGIVRPHLITRGNTVYIGGGNAGTSDMSRRVHKLSRGGKAWESLPITPCYTFALAFVRGCVTVIGGVNIVSSLTTSDLFHFEESSKKWLKRFPAMPTKRCAASATSSESYAIVVGGISKSGNSYLDTVEILDVSTMVWATAAALPQPSNFLSITLCSHTERIYLLGGLTKRGALRSVFSSKLSNLIGSSSSTNEEAAETKVWEEITQTPYYRSACVAIGGKLFVASGLNQNDQITKTVFMYDPELNLWQDVGEMPASRTSCSVFSFEAGHLMVVGGYINPSNWMSSLTTDVMQCNNLPA